MNLVRPFVNVGRVLEKDGGGRDERDGAQKDSAHILSFLERRCQLTKGKWVQIVSLLLISFVLSVVGLRTLPTIITATSSTNGRTTHAMQSGLKPAINPARRHRIGAGTEHGAFSREISNAE